MTPIFIDTSKNLAYYDMPEWCDDDKFIQGEGMELTFSKSYTANGSEAVALLICDRSIYTDESLSLYCKQFML